MTRTAVGAADRPSDEELLDAIAALRMYEFARLQRGLQAMFVEPHLFVHPHGKDPAPDGQWWHREWERCAACGLYEQPDGHAVKVQGEIGSPDEKWVWVEGPRLWCHR